MTPNLPSQKLTSVLALVVTLAAWHFWGAERGAATAVGGALSVLNWVSLRWLLERMSASTDGMRAVMSLLLVAKTGVLMGVLGLLLHHFSLDPLGLVLGLSILFVGPVLAALVGGNGRLVRDNATAGAAGEEH